MPEKTPLILAAEAVRTARSELERIDSRLADLREKSHDLDELKTTLGAARERRAQLLEDALLGGQKANTDEVDKSVNKALQALQKREDEITAVERASATLEAHRQTAQAQLQSTVGAYHEARASRILALADAQVGIIRRAVSVLAGHINEGRALLARLNLSEVPQEGRTWWFTQQSSYFAHIDNIERGISVLLGHAAESDGAALTALDNEFAAAHKLTGIMDFESEQRAAPDHAEPSASSIEPEAARVIRPTLDRTAPGIRG